MILTNVVKVIDKEHPLHGTVLIMDRIHKDRMEVECYEWNREDYFGRNSPHHFFRPDQIVYSFASIITQWLTHTPPCETTHWLNRRKGPDGKDRVFSEHGVFEDEEFPDSDFEPLTEDLIRTKSRC